LHDLTVEPNAKVAHVAQQWHFVENDEHEWRWERGDDTAKSETAFASATECMLDAVRFAIKRRRDAAPTSQKDLLH
jgi:hypothetical protein